MSRERMNSCTNMASAPALEPGTDAMKNSSPMPPPPSAERTVNAETDSYSGVARAPIVERGQQRGQHHPEAQTQHGAPLPGLAQVPSGGRLLTHVGDAHQAAS
jgi:hypothetical protein